MLEETLRRCGGVVKHIGVRRQIQRWFAVAVLTLSATALAEAPATSAAEVQDAANVAIPALPFPDNPDPGACGIPTPWGTSETARLSGTYEGELVEPVVNLYDSHARREITGSAPTGSEVVVLFSQSNPVLNYYLVKTVGPEPTQEGWVPAPFLEFGE